MSCKAPVCFTTFPASSRIYPPPRALQPRWLSLGFLNVPGSFQPEGLHHCCPLRVQRFPFSSSSWGPAASHGLFATLSRRFWPPDVPFSNPETLIALCNYVFISLSCLHISSLPLIWVLREDRDSLIYTLIFINIHTQLGGWNVEEASRALITHSPSREAFSFSRWRHWSFLCPLVALHGQNWWPQMRRFHWRCSGLTRVTLKKKNPSLWWNKISNQDNIVFTGLLRKKKDSFLLSLSWIFWKF